MDFTQEEILQLRVAKYNYYANFNEVKLYKGVLHVTFTREVVLTSNFIIKNFL